MSGRRPQYQQPLPLSFGYPTGHCLSCGRPVRRTFSHVDVPELMDFLGNRISLEQLTEAARRKLGSEGCLFAPKSGVSLCDRKEQLP
jgi:hypothetical protein